MAKIGTAQVRTINIANNAGTGYDEGTTSATAANEAEGPVTLRAEANCAYTGSASGTSASVTVVVTRDRDGAEICRATASFSGNTSGATLYKTVGASGVDMTAGTNESYTATYSIAQTENTTISHTGDKLVAGWDKKH